MNRTLVTSMLLALVSASCIKKHPAAKTSTQQPTSAARCQGPNPNMDYLSLCGPTKGGGTTCKCISQLVMGTDHLGNKWEQDGMPERNADTPWEVRKANAKQMMDLALQAGITMFDTAPIYAEGVENTLGEWMREKKAQDSAFRTHVLTKGGFPFDNGPGTYSSRLRGDRKQIVAQIADQIHWSRSNLNGQIDIYLMHRDDMEFRDYRNVTPPDQTPVEEILAALSDETVYPDIAALDGRSLRDHYTWIGVSNWRTPRVNAAILAAQTDKRLLPPLINSPYFSLFEMSDQVTIHSGGVQVTHAEMMDPSFQQGISIMPYSPLGGFPILDKGTPQNLGRDAWENAKTIAKSLDQNHDRYWGNVFEAVFTPENEKRFYRVWEVSQKMTLDGRKYSIDQWLNAYVLAHPRTDLLAIGPIHKEHLDRTIDSLHLARALKPRRDILDWLHAGDQEDLVRLPPLLPAVIPGVQESRH